MTKLRSLLFKSRSGIAAIEFAFIVPILLVLLMGAVDISQMLFAYYRLDQAVAAGAQYAVLNAANVNSTSGATLASNIATIVSNADGSAWANDSVVVNNGPSVTITNGNSQSSGTLANADSCYCPSGTAPSLTWGSAVICSMACGAGSNAGLSGKYVTVTASVAYTPILQIYPLFNNSTLTQSQAVQTQ